MQAAGFPFLFTGNDPFAVLLAALLADALFAGITGVARAGKLPAEALRRVAAGCERRLNRKHRSRGSRVARGTLVAALMLVLAAAVGVFAVRAVRIVPEGWLLEAAMVALLLNQRRTFDRMGKIIRALRDNRVDAARAGLAQMVTYDARALDEHGVARGAVEVCARTLYAGVLAPIFWYLLLGFPGLLAYRAIDSLAWVVGRPTPEFANFGYVPTILDRISTAIPAALGGVLIAVAAIFVPSSQPGRALRTMSAASGTGSRPGYGWALGAMAGALGLALGGPVRYGAVAVSVPWIGDGRARATVQDLARARFILVVAGLLVAVAIALMELGTTAA